MCLESDITLEFLKILRHHFHLYPELSFEEYKTQEFIENIFKLTNGEIYKINTSILIYFNNNGNKTIAFRAEEDALPIKEINHKYKSLNEGIMHACGHDGHMAILIILGLYISSKKLNNNYLLIFQAGEEKNGGASLLVESKEYQDHLPDEVYALHLFPGLKEGELYSRKHQFLAKCSEISINIYGKANHVSSKENVIDANMIGIKLFNEMYSYFENKNTNENRFVIGKIEGGNLRNIISDKLIVEGTLRNIHEKDFDEDKEFILNIIDKYERKFNSKAEIKINEDYEGVFNDAELFDKLSKIHKIHKIEPLLIGDDFYAYNKYSKALYILLGIDSSSLHTDTFDFNEEILLKGYYFFKSLL